MDEWVFQISGPRGGSAYPVRLDCLRKELLDHFRQLLRGYSLKNFEVKDMTCV